MKTKTEIFEIAIPSFDGETVVRRVPVPVEVYWDEESQDWTLSEEALRAIEDKKAELMGILLPHQLKELRERHKKTKKEMGILFQVGEKTWNRWESGKHRPSRSSNLPIRALYDKKITIEYLEELAGIEPKRRETRVAVAQIKPPQSKKAGKTSPDILVFADALKEYSTQYGKIIAEPPSTALQCARRLTLNEADVPDPFLINKEQWRRGIIQDFHRVTNFELELVEK